MKRNKFSKALKHLKSKKIDEKIKGLEEAAPTNSMSGVYQVTPSTGDAFRMGAGDPDKKFYPKADGTWPSGIPANASDTVYIRKGGYFDSGKGTVPTNQTSVSRDFSFDDVTANGTTNTDTLIVTGVSTVASMIFSAGTNTNGVSYFDANGQVQSTVAPASGISTSNYILTTNASGVPTWTSTIDCGTF